MIFLPNSDHSYHSARIRVECPGQGKVLLLSTMAKVLTAIVAHNLSKAIERHHLLPKTHFGGRPGRSTADAVHYLVDKVCMACRDKRVVSVLFLDVEGAFPNAVTARLTHNLKRRRVPAAIVKYVRQLLSGRKTRLKFDDYVSEVTNITNGIGQGDPISMLLYIIYNADLLELPDNPNAEDSIGLGCNTGMGNSAVSQPRVAQVRVQFQNLGPEAISQPVTAVSRVFAVLSVASQSQGQ